MRPTHPSMALAAYLERLVRGRRVAVLGDVTLAFGERLVDRGARLVHVYDPHAARVAEVLARTADQRPRHLTHAVLEGDLGVRDGAFDVVVIPDLAIFGDPTETLRKMRRLVGSTGIAVIASTNAEAPRRLLDKPGSNANSTDYYGLYDLVSLQFPVVRMLGQAPFVGYTLADFGASGELEVSVDTSLLEITEEPEVFIAIASERKVALDPFVVVEVALADVRKSAGASGAVVDTAAIAEARAKEVAASAAREAEHRAALEVQTARAAKAEAHTVDLEHKLEKLRDVESRMGDAHVRAERLTHQIRDLEEELRKQRDRGTKLAKQLDDEKKARTKAEVELGLSRGPKDVPGTKERIEQLTQEASMVRSRAMELQGELAAAELGINDLVTEREELHERVTTLEQRLAKAEANASDPKLAAKLQKLEAELERTRAEKLEAGKRDKAAAEALAALAPLKQERDRLAETNATLEKRANEFGAERDALSADMEALEGRLLERGQRIATLEADLREGLRVGKELLSDLEEARAVGSEAGPFNGNGSGSLEGSGDKAPAARSSGPIAMASAATELPNSITVQLDGLAARAARAEADLEAARWRISQLEHAGIGFDREDVEPAAIAVELEQALLASQQELATLRRAVGPEGEHVAASVVEQAVLLHQVANQISGAPS